MVRPTADALSRETRDNSTHLRAFSTAEVHAPHVMPWTDSCGWVRGGGGEWGVVVKCWRAVAES